MKIRHKITLWITGTGVLVSLVFSLIIFLEMRELPYRSLDAGLEVIGQILGHLAAEGRIPQKRNLSGDFPVDLNLYWIKVYDGHMKVLYQTNLTRFTDLPLYHRKTAYTVTAFVPKKGMDASHEEDEAVFRVRTVSIRLKGSRYVIQIGKPVGQLQDEVVDLLQGIGVGLLVTTLLLVVLGYAVAGRILRPISVINGLARDISERTLHQRIPLGKSRDELYRLSSSLNRMFDRLQYSFKMQKRFVADASHELKSPITLLLLFMEESIHRKDLSDSFRRRLVSQMDILRRMSRMVKNLLDLSALELKETVEVHELNLSDLARSVLEDYQEVFAARRVGLSVDIPERVEIRGDEDQLRRALINLVDNAVRYNREGGRIEIRISKEDRGIHLSLYNTGTGIAKGELPKVFEQFYRVEKSRSLQHGGSGLGLTIVKRIIELHGGSVEIESELGAWTSVHVYLPFSQRV